MDLSDIRISTLIVASLFFSFFFALHIILVKGIAIAYLTNIRILILMIPFFFFSLPFALHITLVKCIVIVDLTKLGY